MSNKYYYLVASLPYLGFEAEPPISNTAFLEECGKWLPEEDMKEIVSASLSAPEIKPSDGDLLREWKAFDMNLRKELAFVRAAKKRKESYKASDRTKEVLEQTNPLLMEKNLEKIRWNFLEGKSSGYNFDINWLVLYYLKLQILERIATFDKDKGEAFFYGLCEVTYEQAIG